MKRIRSKNPIPKEKNICGFTDEEQKCHDKLMESYGEFLKLDREHPLEVQEFGYAIHLIQGVLQSRVCRRIYPEGWPTYGTKEMI